MSSFTIIADEPVVFEKKGYESKINPDKWTADSLIKTPNHKRDFFAWDNPSEFI